MTNSRGGHVKEQLPYRVEVAFRRYLQEENVQTLWPEDVCLNLLEDVNVAAKATDCDERKPFTVGEKHVATGRSPGLRL